MPESFAIEGAAKRASNQIRSRITLAMIMICAVYGLICAAPGDTWFHGAFGTCPAVACRPDDFGSPPGSC